MSTQHSFLVLGLALGLGACRGNEADTNYDVRSGSQPQPRAAELELDEDDENEIVVPANQIPQAVRAAALAEVPGLVITEAELEGNGVYCVHGTNDGVFTEVEVDSASGEILEVEVGDDDDDVDDDVLVGEEEEDDDDDDENEVDVDVDSIPAAVKDAARAAVPGLVIQGAETDGDSVYDVYGQANGQFTEVEVDADTLEILEVEVGEDDED